MSNGRFDVKWYDHGRESQCPPDPRFPNGKDIDFSGGAPHCKVDLPYPARRCGYYLARCNICQSGLAITTAGRPDDPKSVTLLCNLAGSA